MEDERARWTVSGGRKSFGGSLVPVTSSPCQLRTMAPRGLDAPYDCYVTAEAVPGLRNYPKNRGDPASRPIGDFRCVFVVRWARRNVAARSGSRLLCRCTMWKSIGGRGTPLSEEKDRYPAYLPSSDTTPARGRSQSSILSRRSAPGVFLCAVNLNSPGRWPVLPPLARAALCVRGAQGRGQAPAQNRVRHRARSPKGWYDAGQGSRLREDCHAGLRPWCGVPSGRDGQLQRPGDWPDGSLTAAAGWCIPVVREPWSEPRDAAPIPFVIRAASEVKGGRNLVRAPSRKVPTPFASFSRAACKKAYAPILSSLETR
jgi:hypothetical protein